MIDVELSSRERKLIRDWIDFEQRGSSRFGDDPIILPEEVIVEHKLEHEGPVRFTRHQLELLLEWAEESPKLMVEEEALVKKIKEALEALVSGRKG